MPELLGQTANINITMGSGGDIRINVNGQWAPAHLFAVAGLIGRMANQVIDQAEMQNAIALQTLQNKGLGRTDQ